MVLDLEYEPGECIFVAGVMASAGRTPPQLWQTLTDGPEDEGRLLDALLDAVGQWPTLPIATWNGWSADFPQLA